MTANHILATEPALPQPVTQHDNIRLIWFPIVGRERATHDRIDAEYRKEIRRGDLGGDLFRVTVTRQLRVPLDERGHVFKNLVLLFPVKEVAEVDHILLFG